MGLKEVLMGVEEVITKEELAEALSEKTKGYIGFEPSGLVHIGWLIWAWKVQDLVEAGVDMTVLAATWHAWINDKLGGEMDRIKACARYVWHFLRAAGVDVSRIKFVDAEDLVRDPDYWRLVLKVAKSLTLARVKRATTIMGRKEVEVKDFSMLIYPCMQVADIFYLDVTICLGGMDQRRAHVLAREVAPKLGYRKPIAIHTPLLIGLQGAQRMDVEGEELMLDYKMSKSKPETCIFVHDGPEEIKRKIRAAYCPPRIIEGNPVMEIARLIVFRRMDTLHIERPSKYGGPLDVESFDELATIYSQGRLHPLDLKNAIAEALIEILSPIRRYFEENREAKELADLVKEKITR